MSFNGGKYIRNKLFPESIGSLGIVVMDKQGKHVGITCKHVLYVNRRANKGDLIEGFFDGEWKEIGYLGSPMRRLDICVIHFFDNIPINPYQIGDFFMHKLSFKKVKRDLPCFLNSGLQHNIPISAKVYGYKNKFCTIEMTGSGITKDSDSGSVWYMSFGDYNIAFGIHTGSRREMASAINIDYIFDYYNLKKRI
ncbi:MAG: hypothetical protein JJU02_03165 [Cryomorphaceae bacterium]|nr:hypothetical protein [Cryomorphaceae bacterium]